MIRKIFKKEYDELDVQKNRWHATKNKGWNREKKKKSFNSWLKNNITYRNYVYVFWAGNECEYVGRTMAGGKTELQGLIFTQLHKAVKYQNLNAYLYTNLTQDRIRIQHQKGNGVNHVLYVKQRSRLEKK